MKDSFDFTSDVITLINTPVIKAMITGGIYADDRPNNSKVIDIVVNCLGVTNRWNQKGSGNVNIYVPNLPSGRKDSGTMRTIAKAVLPLIESQNRATFQTDVEDGGTPMQDTDGSWFYNIPFNYYSIQEKYKNV